MDNFSKFMADLDSSSPVPPMAPRPPHSLPPVRWEIGPGLTEYENAVERMEGIVRAICEDRGNETVWAVEHPPLYTAGTSAREADLLDPNRLPLYKSGRGGQFTYHGPGQRVVYLMLDLRRRKPDIRAYVSALQNWVIDALAEFKIHGECRAGRVGVWVKRTDKPPLPDGSIAEDKIAAVGIRLRRWVSYHGVAINVDPQLEHYKGIVPCGISQYGVTSMAELGCDASMAELDAALKRHFQGQFGPAGE